MPARTRPAAAQERQEAPEAAPPNGHTPEPPEERTAPQGGELSGAELLDTVRHLSVEQAAELEAEWRAAQADDHPLTVWEAIAEVTRQIGAIEKTGRSTEGYRFRGIDQALAALHPILGDVGLVIMPGGVVREQWETRATAKGGTLNVARLLVSYTFVGPDGTRLAAAAWGEGADSGDKATQKAHSQSYKTLVFQTFTIPTEASAEDEPDATNEAARPFSAEEVQRANTAAQAAADAGTVEALAGVCRRALHLLDVPITMVDGSLVPLSVLFDQRRAALEAVAGAER
jgi:hypothetical protein